MRVFFGPAYEYIKSDVVELEARGGRMSKRDLRRQI